MSKHTSKHTLPASVRAQAERTVYLSLEQASQLPDLLGRICHAMLKTHGWYSATVGGVRTLYVRLDT